MFDAPFDNLEQMSRYIKAIPRQGIVVLDNNIIPDIDSRQLTKTSADSIEGIIKFNYALAESIQNFSYDRVIITKEARAEMNPGFDFVIKEIKRKSGNASLYSRLIESYDTLNKKVNASKRINQSATFENNCIYESMRNIVRKLVLDFPELKKKPSSGDEPDEKIVAYAFAQAIAQDKKVFILSSDADIRNISEELYTVLTAKNVVGVDTVAGSRLKCNNVEVVCFDVNEKRFQTVFNARLNGKDSWTPKNGYSTQDTHNLKTYVQQNLVPAEVELGNGKALAVIVEQRKQKQVPKNEDKANEDKALTDVEISEADSTQNKTNTVSEEVLSALEKIYARVGVDSESLNIDNQEDIETAIETCRDFKLVYQSMSLPTDSLDTEIKKLEQKSLPHLIKTLEQECEALNAKSINLLQQQGYTNSDENEQTRKSVKANLDLIDKNVGLIEQYESQLKELQTPECLKGATTKQVEVYNAFKEAGAEITDAGIWASNSLIKQVTGWTPAYISKILTDLEKEKLIERKQAGRSKTNFLSASVLDRFKLAKP